MNEAVDWGLLDVEMIDLRARWSTTKTPDQFVNQVRLTFDVGFDRPVAAIANPSGDPKASSFVAAPGTEEHTLDTAADADLAGDPYHTTEMSGASSAFIPTTL